MKLSKKDEAIERFLKQLDDMFVRQQSHNVHVHPQWERQNYPFCRAIWMECAELIEHYGWKWWKQQQRDDYQVYLEIVDIWHFGLSYLMVRGEDRKVIAKQLTDVLEDGEDVSFIENVENLARFALEGSFDIRAFARVLSSANLSLDLLYALYIGKNTLNVFRQLNGYKDGSYEKLWDGKKEDNQFLVEILMSMETQGLLSDKAILRALAERYPKNAKIE